MSGAFPRLFSTLLIETGSLAGRQMSFRALFAASPTAVSAGTLSFSDGRLSDGPIFPALYVLIHCFSETGNNVVKPGPDALAITSKC